MSKVYKGDVGTRIELDAGTDISSAEELVIKYQKPDGTTGEWDGELDDDNQTVYYVTQEDDLDQSGEYQVQLYIKLLVWEGSGEKASFTVYDPIEEDEEADITGNYISAADIDNWNDEQSLQDKQDAINRAEQLIEKLTKDVFYTKAFVVTLDGNGKDRISLGLNANILLVTKVEIFDVEVPSDYWLYDKNFVYANTAEIPSTLLSELLDSKDLFSKGLGNVKITGTMGYATTPPAIKQAAIVLVQAENDPTRYARYSVSFSSESLGDYSYSKEMNLTGIVEADKLLKDYLKKKIKISVV